MWFTSDGSVAVAMIFLLLPEIRWAFWVALRFKQDLVILKSLNLDQGDPILNCFEILGQNLAELSDPGSQKMGFQNLIGSD